ALSRSRTATRARNPATVLASGNPASPYLLLQVHRERTARPRPLHTRSPNHSCRPPLRPAGPPRASRRVVGSVREALPADSQRRRIPSGCADLPDLPVGPTLGAANADARRLAPARARAGGDRHR